MYIKLLCFTPVLPVTWLLLLHGTSVTRHVVTHHPLHRTACANLRRPTTVRFAVHFNLFLRQPQRHRPGRLVGASVVVVHLARLIVHQSCLCSFHVLTFCQCWMLFFNLLGVELDVHLRVVVLCSVRDQFLTRSEEIVRVYILFLTLFVALFVTLFCVFVWLFCCANNSMFSCLYFFHLFYTS